MIKRLEAWLARKREPEQPDQAPGPPTRFTKGQHVTQYLSSARIPRDMVVINVHEGLVLCQIADQAMSTALGYPVWTFDDETGVEEDATFGWGVATGITGSTIEEKEPA